MKIKNSSQRTVSLKAIAADFFGTRRLETFDDIIYHHNPLIILKKLHEISSNSKEILVVTSFDYIKSDPFPYNLLNEYLVRNFCEQLIFNESARTKEDVLSWYERHLEKVIERLNSQSIKVCVAQGRNTIKATRNYEADNNEYSIIDFGFKINPTNL